MTNATLKTACMIILLMFLVAGSSVAGEVGSHFTNGGEGIKVATLPPRGLYYKMYNFLYIADKVTDENGSSVDMDFDLTNYVNVHRILWVSDMRLLGADCAFNILVPLVYTDMSIENVGSGSKFALGDIAVESALAWHGSNYDAAAAFALILPTGAYDQNDPLSPGKDMWTYMFTLGWTHYFDREKTWAFSICPRYEIHGEKNELDVTYGHDFHFEWGFSKTIVKNWIWDIGLVGGCQWQITDDRGSQVTWDKEVHDRVYSMGPEIAVTIPSLGSTITFRTLCEFDAKDRTEGNLFVLSFAKAF